MESILSCCDCPRTTTTARKPRAAAAHRAQAQSTLLTTRRTPVQVSRAHLANGQAERGHHVGIVADSLTGGTRAEAALAER